MRGSMFRRWLFGASAGLSACGPATPVATVSTGPEAAPEAANGDLACSKDGYCRVTPVIEAAQFSAIWGSGPNDVYAVAYGGEVIHFDGSRWTSESMGVNGWMEALWGSGPDDVYAVGEAGVIRRQGGKWKVEHDAQSTLQGVWGSGPKDVMAVGDRGTIVHFDGSEWSAMPGSTGAELEAVWGSGPDDYYAIGTDRSGRSTRDNHGVVIHYDGASWGDPVSLGRELVGVWGKGPGDAWVAGKDDQGKMGLWHLEGSEWKAQRLPRNGEIHAISGAGGNPILLGLVGVAETNQIPYQHGLAFVIEREGDLWKRRDLTSFSYAIGQPRWAIWGEPGGAAFVSGWWGVAGKIGPDGLTSKTGNDALGKNLLGVWGTSPTDVVAVGLSGTMLRWDGRAWRQDPAGRNHDFTAIRGAGDTLAATARSGVVLVRRKGTWRSLETGTSEDLTAVWVSGDEVFAAGDNGTVVRCQGDKCAVLPTGSKKRLSAIWGKSPTEVYAGGDEGTLLRWDGATWRQLAMPKVGLWAIGPDGKGGVFAGTYSDTYAIEGGVPRKVASLGARAFTDGADGEVRAVAGGGGAPSKVHAWTGGGWRAEQVPTRGFDEGEAGLLFGIWSGGGEVFVVGQGGLILHKKR